MADRQPRSSWRFGVYELDPASGELRKQGRRVRLPDQAIQVLIALLEQPGEVVTRQALKDRLWTSDTFVDFDANLNTAVSLLRDALGDSAKSPRFIETLPRRGYRFIDNIGTTADASPAPAAAAPPARAIRTSRRWIVGVGCLSILVLAGVAYRPVPSGSPVNSIAVLPLVSVGPAADEQQYLADGLTSALITELARLGVPNVISETSVMQYRDVKKPLPVIARELGADVLVEGSVVREGNVVRVNAQLIDAREDRHIWARSYEREMHGILQLQGEIANAIVAEVRQALAVPQSERPRVNPAAHEAYLKGRYALRHDLEDRRGRAVAYFEQAIQLEPAFALAYAGLAEYYAATDALPPREALSKTREFARKALSLDASLAGAHLSLAMGAVWGEWDWTSGEREFLRALDLDPNDPGTRRWYALFLDLVGRTEAASHQLARVSELDPVSPDTYRALAFHAFVERRYDAALAQILRLEDLNPHDPKVFEAYSSLYLHTGQYDRAIAAGERGVELWGRDPAFLTALSMAHATAGAREQAEVLMQEIREIAGRRHVPPSWFAMMHVSLGEIDRAFEWLERAYGVRDSYLLQLKARPEFDRLRGDARYGALLERLAFPGTGQ